jgi:hypothetical protein
MTNITEKAMLVSLTINQWTARRFDREVTDTINEQHGSAPDAGRFNKLLVKKERIQPVRHAAGEARRIHTMLTQPWLDGGTRVLSSAMYQRYATEMVEAEAAFTEAAANFAAGYPDYVAERKVELNGMFRDADYPASKMIGQHFGFAIRHFPFPDPEDFRVKLDPTDTDLLKEQLQRDLEKAMADTMRDPIIRLYTTATAMVDRLSGYEPGDKKAGVKPTGVFRDTLVTNLRELVDLLPAFNLTDDPELKALTDAAAQVCTVEPADLRDDAALRIDTINKAADIAARANALMV